MITLDENDVKAEDRVLSFDEDVQEKVQSLANALNNNDLPQDLKEFVNSLKNEAAEDDEMEEDISDAPDDVYESDVGLEFADENNVDILDGEDTSVGELDSMF